MTATTNTGSSKARRVPAALRKKRLRVLYMIDHAGALGGAERFVVGLAAHMPRDRIEPWVCSTRHGDERAIRPLAEAGIPHLNLGRTSKWHVHRLAGLVALVRRERFDVIHAHKFGSNVWGSLVGHLCRLPVVIAHEHNWSYAGDRTRAWIDGHLIGRLATRFIAVSGTAAERMVELEHVPARKVLVMPTGYVPHSGPASVDIRRELGLGTTAPLVGMAAGLRPEKALEVMLEAHARLVASVSNAHLVIAGEGPCREEVEHRISQLGIASSVHLLGPRRDIDAILRGVDVGVISSDWEGMPLFVFECMAARTPLVATAVGGVPEVVVNGETGLLVPPRDPSALATAIERALTEPELGMRLATAAATRLDEFAIDAVARRFADLYEELAIHAWPA